MENPKIVIAKGVEDGLRDSFPENEIIRYGSTIQMDFVCMEDNLFVNKTFKIAILEEDEDDW